MNVHLLEVTGSGAVALNEYRSVLPDLSASGEKVKAFRGFDEFVDQVWRLLPDVHIATTTSAWIAAIIEIVT